MLQQNVQRVGVAVLASPVEHRGSIIALLERARERRPAVRLLLVGLWSCVGKGKIRHGEGLAIDMKFTAAAAFLIRISQRLFVWEMTGGSLRRLTSLTERM